MILQRDTWQEQITGFINQNDPCDLLVGPDANKMLIEETEKYGQPTPKLKPGEYLGMSVKGTTIIEADFLDPMEVRMW